MKKFTAGFLVGIVFTFIVLVVAETSGWLEKLDAWFVVQEINRGM